MSYLLRKLSVPATLKAKQSFQWVSLFKDKYRARF